MKLLTKNSGFTLIEIMVAMLIMAGLSLVMATSVKTGLESRKKVQLQISEESLVRDAMRLMVADVGAAFHFRDYTVGIYNKVLELRKKKAATPANPNAPVPPPAPGVPPQTGASTAPAPTADPLAAATPIPVPVQLTGFNGNENSMTFTVRNHVRRFVDSKESDISRVSYFLRNCRSGPKKQSSSCLMRIEKTIASDEFPLSPTDEDDAKAIVLAPNVTEFTLRYIGVGMEDYVTVWDSSPTSAVAAAKDKFPDAVEIVLAIHNKQIPESKLRMLSWLAPIRSANNESKADKEAAQKEAQANGAPGTGPNGAPNGRQQ